MVLFCSNISLYVCRSSYKEIWRNFAGETLHFNCYVEFWISLNHLVATKLVEICSSWGMKTPDAYKRLRFGDVLVTILNCLLLQDRLTGGVRWFRQMLVLEIREKCWWMLMLKKLCLRIDGHFHNHKHEDALKNFRFLWCWHVLRSLILRIFMVCFHMGKISKICADQNSI